MFELLELENSNSKPYDHLISKEYIEGVMKAGALFSMLENKKINTTMLFSLLLDKPDYQAFFVEITSSEDFKEALMYLLYLNPSLVKSKITKSYIRKYNGKQKKLNRIRKADLQ